MPSSIQDAVLAAIEHRFVTIDELAARLSRNRFTLYHWLKEAPERLPRVTRIHSRVLFLESDVRAYFEAFEAEASKRVAAVVDPAAPPVRKRGRPRKEEVAAAVGSRR